MWRCAVVVYGTSYSAGWAVVFGELSTSTHPVSCWSGWFVKASGCMHMPVGGGKLSRPPVVPTKCAYETDEMLPLRRPSLIQSNQL